MFAIQVRSYDSILLIALNQIYFDNKNMQLKSSDTFFPTRFRPTTANTNPDRHLAESTNSKSYKLVKKRSCTQQSCINGVNQNQSENIFRNTQIGDSSFNYQKDRPVGGIQTFLRQQNKKNRIASANRITNRTNSPDVRKKQAQNDQKPGVYYQTKRMIQPKGQQQEQNEKQQIFKQHHPYQPQITLKSTQKSVSKKSKNEGIKSYKSVQHNNWVVKQTENYQNKMSVLNQVYYKKPLVEKYGDRYFEFLLRNRYEEDFPPPVYIHQIKSELHARNANNDKFISKIKKIHPNIKNFQKLVVKGKHFTNSISHEADFNI